MATRASRLPRRSAAPALSWPRVRNRLIVAGLVLVALAAAYTLWFRNSSLVAIEDVRVTGADVPSGVEGRLTAAATGLSTLNVDRAAIESAVADDPSVVALKIETDFPHAVTIDVQSRGPARRLDARGGPLAHPGKLNAVDLALWVALEAQFRALDADDTVRCIIVRGAGGTFVAGDGTVLATGVDRPDGIPEIAGGGSLGDRVEGSELAAARILGAVPGPLQPQVSRAHVDEDHGVVAELNGGIELRFGSPANGDQKWRAAAAVLADPTLTSATYIDLSAPLRPVVG